MFGGGVTSNVIRLPIAESAAAIDREFDAVGDWSQQLQHLMTLGRALPGLSSADRSEDRRVHGCQSQLWVAVRHEAERLRIAADSDAMVMRGVLSLILRLYDDRAASAVREHMRGSGAGLAIVERLAPNRTNGLRALLRRIEDAASAVETAHGPVS